MTRLTFGGEQYRYPTWSPDGHYVVFASVGHGIFQARADGASRPQALTHSQTFQSPGSFTPDGKRLAYVESRGGAAQRVGQGDAPAPPQLTLIADAGDYVKISLGQLDGTAAFMQGKLKIKGDMGLAMKMASIFRRPG